jgi:histidinol-phosphatase (PHP family)
MPPIADRYLYPEERNAGLDAVRMAARFDAYITEARRLQQAYRDRIDILVGFETEGYPGSAEQVDRLVQKYRPDYIVGSLHHLEDIPFDYNGEEYRRAIEASGGVEQLYLRYFDRQHELLQALRPSVVGHFDLIRLFDPDYPRTLMLPGVRERIRRNLELVRDLDLILDYNVAALRKGAAEPYIARSILEQVRDLGIAIVPGDDSHGVRTVGQGVSEGIAILADVGVDTDWRRPKKGF